MNTFIKIHDVMLYNQLFNNSVKILGVGNKGLPLAANSFGQIDFEKYQRCPTTMPANSVVAAVALPVINQESKTIAQGR